MTTTFVQITDQFEGLHNWPEAPEQVAFLRDPHRHIFKVRIRVSVTHDDRELEFFILRSRAREFYPKTYNIGRQSCEQMANKILNGLKSIYKVRTYEVEVSEDGENSAIAVWP